MDVNNSDSENDSDYVLEEGNDADSDVDVPVVKLENISVSKKRKMDSIFDEMLDSEIKYTKSKMKNAICNSKINNSGQIDNKLIKKPKAFDVLQGIFGRKGAADILKIDHIDELADSELAASQSSTKVSNEALQYARNAKVKTVITDIKKFAGSEIE